MAQCPRVLSHDQDPVLLNVVIRVVPGYSVGHFQGCDLPVFLVVEVDSRVKDPVFQVIPVFPAPVIAVDPGPFIPFTVSADDNGISLLTGPLGT